MRWRPETLRCGELVLRPLTAKDERAWLTLRSRNRAWLRPWEATEPGGRIEKTVSFPRFVRMDRRQWWTRRAINMVIEVEGRMVGRICLSAIEWGAARTGSLGYWIDEGHAGNSYVPRAAAMLTRYAFREGLHRVEIAVRPENEASVRVAKKLGFRDEGLRRGYLYIDGDWRDHRVFAITAAERQVGDVWECDEAPRH